MQKFEGEVFTIQKTKDAVITMSDEDINLKYKRGEIRIVTEQARFSIKSVESMLDSKDYKLDPEYQRRKRWDNGKKSRLIESFIMNVPLPPIFLYEYDYAKYEVMDGLQRLTSVYDFYKGNFALTGLEYWKELEGKRYSELPTEIQGGIDRRYMSSIILLAETAKTPEEAENLKQIVFERLNSGGAELTAQETRNALYNGKFNQLCLKLSKNDKFRKMWQIPLEEEGEEKWLTSDAYREMADVELVLRFFAYRFIDNLSGTIEDFLDAYLKQANKFPDSTLVELENVFINTINIVYEIFGEEAFISPVYERRVTKPQKTIYDPLMQSVAKIVSRKNKLLRNATEIKNNKYEYGSIHSEDGSRLFEGRKATPSTMKVRVSYFDNLFDAYAG